MASLTIPPVEEIRNSEPFEVIVPETPLERVGLRFILRTVVRWNLIQMIIEDEPKPLLLLGTDERERDGFFLDVGTAPNERLSASYPYPVFPVRLLQDAMELDPAGDPADRLLLKGEVALTRIDDSNSDTSFKARFLWLSHHPACRVQFVAGAPFSAYHVIVRRDGRPPWASPAIAF